MLSSLQGQASWIEDYADSPVNDDSPDDVMLALRKITLKAKESALKITFIVTVMNA